MFRKFSLALCALALSVAVSTTADAQTVRIGTCGTGGYWFQSGTVVANLINKYGDGLNAKAIPTACTSYNLTALGNDAIEFGLSLDSMDKLAEAGKEPFADKGTKGKIRSLSTWYTNYLHIFTLDPDIKSIEDLRGKRLAVGAPKGGTFRQTMALLKAAGMDPEKDTTLAKVNLEAGSMQLRGGQVDAQFWSMPTNNPTMSELTSTRDVYFIPVSEATAQKLPESLNLRLRDVAKDTYPTLKSDTPMLSGSVTMVTRANLDADVVEKVLGAVYGHLDEFYQALPATAREVNKKAALSGLAVPLHDGANAYYSQRDFPGLAEFKERVE